MPADHGTPVGGDERQAEIEGVAPAEVEVGVAVLRAMLGDILGTDEEVHDMALGVLLGAARVRDARNDDLPPDDGSGYVTGTAYSRMVDHYEALLAARSPQGEDHDLARLLGKIADRAKYLGEAAWTEEGTMLVGRQIHAWASEALALADRPFEP